MAQWNKEQIKNLNKHYQKPDMEAYPIHSMTLETEAGELF